jgi:Fe-S oxidoreductase
MTSWLRASSVFEGEEMTIKLEDYRTDALICPRCSNCKWVDHIYVKSHEFAKICPINARYVFNAYSAHGMLDIALAIMNGQLDYTSKLLDIIYKCTLCGACDMRCKRNLDIEVLLVLEGLRLRCVEDGVGPMPAHKAVAENVERTHNRYGAPHGNRFKWMPKDITPTKQADFVYFVGCSSAYRHPEIAQATAKILGVTGADFMIMQPDEWCCGRLLYSTGQLDSARTLMEHNIEAIEKSGASTVITSCAECYKTLKVDYPKCLDRPTEEMKFRVLHISEYAGELIRLGNLEFSRSVDLRVTYHDPCHLGRLSEPWMPWHGEHKKFGILEPPKTWRRGTHGIYQPPREILASIPGLVVLEMERMRENAWCCGAGGGTREAFEEFSLWTAGERLKEAGTTGADAIISACPYCEENLRQAARTRREKIQVYDITEIMIQALGDEV